MKRLKMIFILASSLFLIGCSSSEPESSTADDVTESEAVVSEPEVEESTEVEAMEEEETAVSSTTLTAIRVDTVSLDMNASFWSDAPMLIVPTVGTTDDLPDGSDVILQAAYDGTNIIIRAEWADDTMSLLKNAWTWDGTAFTKSGNEDRILIHFPIENWPEFASKGCTEACHNTADDPEVWYMATSDESFRLDQWHWKSARTHPIGFADDKWVGVQTDPTDVESAHHGDAKDSGGDTTNANEDGTGPAFMHGTDLASQYILAGDEVPIDTSNLPAGTVIPGYVLAPLVGSRGDVLAQAEWANGRWVVVLMRLLDTGHDDDIVFVPPRPVPFGMSIIDDGGGLDHTNSPEVLTLEWQQ